MKKDTKIALGFTGLIIVLIFATSLVSNRSQGTTGVGNGVATENGVQVINIAVKGGYSPSRLEAKAGVPTELRFTTNGTYDCSSMVVIPKLSIQKTLPATGTDKIALNASQATGTLQGQCGMGMYNFEIAFK